MYMYYYNLIDLNIFDEFGPIEVIIVLKLKLSHVGH